MPQYASQVRFDGVEMQHHQIRFAGTLDLDERDLEDIRLDGLTVMIVAVRTGGAGIKINDDSGEATLKYVGTIQAALPLQGEARERAMASIRDRNGEVPLPVTTGGTPAAEAPASGYAEPIEAPASAGTSQQEPAPVATAPQPAPPAGVDPDTGEVRDTVTEETDVTASSPDEPGQDAPIDVEREARPIERSGPPVDDSPSTPGTWKTGGFDPADAPGPPPPPQADAPVAGEVEQVGNVHRDDYKGDPHLRPDALEQLTS